jgi:thiol-disulfide isomerase/thioredoxin
MTFSTPRRRLLTIGTLGAATWLAMRSWRAWVDRSDQGVAGIELHAEPRALPALRLVDASGASTSLAAFRGRAVLLNFWATWCPPCRAEMPDLDRLQGTLGGPRFEVVAVSIDVEGIAVVAPYWRSLGITRLRAWHDAFHDAGALVAAGIPLTLLVDAHGREVGRRRGPARWDDAALTELIRRRLLAWDRTRGQPTARA